MVTIFFRTACGIQNITSCKLLLVRRLARPQAQRHCFPNRPSETDNSDGLREQPHSDLVDFNQDRIGVEIDRLYLLKMTTLFALAPVRQDRSASFSAEARTLAGAKTSKEYSPQNSNL